MHWCYSRAFPTASQRTYSFLVHGFDRAMIAGLVLEGLATAQREVVTSSSRTVMEVLRIRITDAGRMALEG
jgi:hypothetical protein